MDILGSIQDVHSFALPEFARIIDTHLSLKVNFSQKVLEGKATLTIERKSLAKIIILDNYKLDIIKVTDSITGSPLEYYIGFHDTFESSFNTQLPQHIEISSSYMSRGI